MRVTRLIPIGSVDVDRWALDLKTFSFAGMMINRQRFPPIKVSRRKCGRYRILDGRHRITASKIIGRMGIEARFSTDLEAGGGER